jgi:pyridoxal phosphate enzyme (YggS family)
MRLEPLVHNLSATQARIAAAAMRYGRSPQSVQLLAISKGQPASALQLIAEAGQRDFGENYVQEALDKIAALERLALTWHFTGQVQGNKTRQVAENFAWVHTIDRERIATRLNEQRPHNAPPLNICVQVSLEDEPGKGGVEPHEVAALAAKLRALPRLRLRGLMCLPPHRETFEEQLGLFRRMSECFADLRAQGFDLDTLSMGMSGDLEAAVAAGATLVRVGTAIFGERI